MYLEHARVFRDIRLKSGLSQKAMADALGFSSSQSVGHLERGTRTLPLDKLHKFSSENRKLIIDAMVIDYRNSIEKGSGDYNDFI